MQNLSASGFRPPSAPSLNTVKAKASGFINAVFCEEEVYILEKMGVTPPAPIILVAGPHHGTPFIWFKVSLYNN